MNPETRACQNCKQNFTIEPADFDFYKKIDVPPPTFCPRCRFERRLIWRNESVLYKRPDSLTGKEIFAEFSKDFPAAIYDVDYWKSDDFDPMKYGRDYDFNKPFFPQFKDFLYSIPWPSRSVVTLINSDYCAEAGYLKNCYLVFNADTSENCAYSVRVWYTKDSFDLLSVSKGELCYGSTRLTEAFRVFFSYSCGESRDIWCSRDLVGCSDCVGCVGLRKKSHYIFNVPYTKEEYVKEVAKLKLNTHSGLQATMRKMDELAKTRPRRFMEGVVNINSSGDNLFHTKNTKECWEGSEMENCKYCQMTYRGATDCYDYSIWGDKASRVYESLTCGYEIDSLKFCFDCWPSCERLEYSVFMRSSADCFASIGLKKKQHCIFNKQYSKEEYDSLVKKIKEQMNAMPYVDKQGKNYKYGEFFPVEFAPYGYNESQLQSIFPLTESQAKAKGFEWYSGEHRRYETTMKASDLPDDILAADDDILKQIIECSGCQKAYRIIPVEFQFLKTQKIPLPRECWNCRLAKRATLINPPVFYDRKCTKCLVDIRTTYAPDRPEIVYCETCYNAEVV